MWSVDAVDIHHFNIYWFTRFDVSSYIPRTARFFAVCPSKPEPVVLLCDTILDNSLGICVFGVERFLSVPASQNEFTIPADTAARYTLVITAVDSAGNESLPSAGFTVLSKPEKLRPLAVMLIDTVSARGVHYDSLTLFYRTLLEAQEPVIFAMLPRRARGETWPPNYSELAGFESIIFDDPLKDVVLRDHPSTTELTISGTTIIYLGAGSSFERTSGSSILKQSLHRVTTLGRALGIDTVLRITENSHNTIFRDFLEDTLFHYFDPIGAAPAPGSPFPAVTYHHTGFNKPNLNDGPIPLKGIMYPVSDNVEILYTYISGRDPVSFFHGGVTGMKYTAETHTAYTFLMSPWEFEPEQATEFFRVLFGDIQTDVDDDPGPEILPKTFALAQNYPNPFNPATTINFSLPQKAQVSLTVYNILGQQVTTLVNDELSAGEYSVTWDAAKYASGIYFYSLKTGQTRLTKKALLVK